VCGELVSGLKLLAANRDRQLCSSSAQASRCLWPSSPVPCSPRRASLRSTRCTSASSRSVRCTPKHERRHLLHHTLLHIAGLFATLAMSERRRRRRRRLTALRGATLGADIAAQLLRPEGLSARTRALLQEVDARTWLDTALKTLWRRYHPAMSHWLKNYLETHYTDAVSAFFKELSILHSVCCSTVTIPLQCTDAAFYIIYISSYMSISTNIALSIHIYLEKMTTFLLSRTSRGEEPLDTGGGRVSLPRCLFWSSGYCQRFGAGNVSRSGLSPFVVLELYDMRDKKNKKNISNT